MYTVTEWELLSVVKNINQSRTILLGQRLRIYIDHKTLHVRNLMLIEY